MKYLKLSVLLTINIVAVTMGASMLSAIFCFATLLASDAFLHSTKNTKKISRFLFPLFANKNDLRLQNNHGTTLNRSEFGSVVVATLIAIPNFSNQKASAVMMEQPKEKFFEIGVTLDVDIAKARFQNARRTVEDLVSNFDSISKEGGDNVRRYLGTVGTTSAMYGIEKVLKNLQNEANDIVAYTENMDDFVYYLRAADTAVYSANFVEFSAAKTKPEKFFDDAKSDCKNILLHMDNMANELNL